MAGKGREWALRKLDELPAIPGTILAAPLDWPDDEEDTMGMSVDIYYGNHCEIADALIKAGCKDSELLDRVLLRFGVKLGAYYVILNNEHIDTNPFYEVSGVLEAAFKSGADGEFFGILLDLMHRGVSYADASTVCEELGIEWQDEED